MPALFEQAESVTVQATLLAESLERTAQSVDRIAARFEPIEGAPDEARMDVETFLNQSTVAIDALTVAATNLESAVQGTQDLLESPAWGARLDDADRIAKRQYMRAGVVILAFLVGLFGVIVGSQIARKRLQR